ncbi:putative stress-associated endoplasmic reticulum protein 2 [Iris pallida]|uniref:Stress-associated endoplasmic reticulum protein 2 n=1 Tax=Iris pallida TaxID=29817 RepID=A0AAX6ED84_IRIPA|nr:putative stress-associated endoplasmic reticulum protein 2 [Iris pallida]KAJ6802032.1 putative stress-associated endoplasmic reticulum protein 2 [Iris pallida]KAJ6811980.1 putative stress-associated endoplasmic reticulum protein 2 [Iris pallida]KAJ6829373.1 putative stress-associated endoplasmic reticulum protein 2 [Iris pallida]KAJ6831228.1 putative stress-associated endoplasmic reticulum protein 2 [Iris pallida]
MQLSFTAGSAAFVCWLKSINQTSVFDETDRQHQGALQTRKLQNSRRTSQRGGLFLRQVPRKGMTILLGRLCLAFLSLWSLDHVSFHFLSVLCINSLLFSLVFCTIMLCLFEFLLSWTIIDLFGGINASKWIL